MIGYQPRPVTYRGAKPRDFVQNGFVGMYDSKAKASEQPTDAPLLINMLPSDVNRPAHAVLRAGLTRIGVSATIQLSAAGGKNPQWIGLGIVLALSTLTRGPLIWWGGELFEVTSVTGATFVKVLSTAQLAAAGITLSATDNLGACVFNGQLVFTQVSKRPFMWDGTTGAGLTVLTNAPQPSFNPVANPTTYFGKLFFISTSREIQWSEENQPNVGYTAGGYNNAWQLTETGTSILLAIYGTNEGLYYGRSNAIGVIRGSVSSTFSTDGVRESVSPDVGLSRLAGSAMRYSSGTLFWFDSQSRPWAWRAGTGVVALWKQLPRQYLQENLDVAHDLLSLYQVGEEGLTRLVLHNISLDAIQNRVSFSGVAPNNGNARVSLVFDVETLRPLGWETFSTANKPTTLRSQWVAHGSVAGLSSVDEQGEVYVDESGYVFYRALAMKSTGQYWDQAEVAPNGQAVTGTILGPMHGWSAQLTDWQFDQVTLVIDGQSTSVASATLLTSRAPNLVVANPQTLTDSASDVPSERAITFGLNQSGRWGRVVAQVQAGAAGSIERPAIHGWRLRGYARGAAPSLP